MRVPVPERILPAEELGRVHFVGIGGAGLSAIARLMLARGITVSGSDGNPSATLDKLREAGATVYVGHAAEQVHDADTLVVSTAVREDNPEIVEAQRLGLRLLPRSAGLAAVMAGRRVLAVAGTHGKTTTTSLLTVALQAAGADPTYAVGGDLTATGTNAGQGASDLFVAEADESDGAFLVYRPHVAVITNVEADHLDQWGTEEAYREAFAQFIGRVDRADDGGLIVACVDDEGAADLRSVATSLGRRFVGVGESDLADVRAVDVVLEGTTSSFTVLDRDGLDVRELGRITLQIPGRHYVADALAALTVGLRLGYPFELLKAGLESFTGTRRRMERKGEAAGVRVYDSYAHHPAEIAGDLVAARSVAGEGRLIVAFQPHLVSRTRIFGEQMGAELGAADEVVVLDVYLAREEADPEVTGRLVLDAVPHERKHFAPGLADAAEVLARIARPGDLVVTLGAGSITEVGPKVLALLEQGV
ncbi:UDP-N-acetylmuramate--L-alanine ligase [Nocardioides nematodiphilus]|uniref:UDP-N-acetylmuramate--L-alanine ligase n=1 Tax=Nocardioides nematodiphilus TaxID=2849669 RepID=UPI001CDA0372|nr:UDP-N-acetylmuramate--L-alanine ligase [Nocardioides nematodiphilus]MCA1982492.1 UDP-N-acetylmuramate--L-alanine ligase [Nocardioides nematodiphilus]